MSGNCDSKTGNEARCKADLDKAKSELKSLIKDTECCVNTCKESMKCATSQDQIDDLNRDISDLTVKLTSLRSVLVKNSVDAVRKGLGGSGGKTNSKKYGRGKRSTKKMRAMSRRKRKTSNKYLFF